LAINLRRDEGFSGHVFPFPALKAHAQLKLAIDRGYLGWVPGYTNRK
jgi:hypothetical protein